VDAFKRQAQKPNTTNFSAQANRRQTQSQKPALTSAINASDNSVSTPARSPAPTAHINTPAIDTVPIPSQPRIPRTLPPPFLLGKVFPTSHPSPSIRQSQNPHSAYSLKGIRPPSSPAPPPPQYQHCVPGISRPQPILRQDPAYFRPHTFEPHSITPSEAHIVMDCVVAPTTPTDRKNTRLTHPSYSKRHSTPTKLERETVSPHPHQRTHRVQPSPRSRSNQSVIKASPRSETNPPSPSFAQARHFFEYPALPGTTSEQPWSEPLKEELHPTPSPSPLRTTCPPRKRANPYDQLPSSPDSEWSTLKPQTRMASGKGRSKAPELKSGKFRLPLSFGNTAPKEPPRKKARVVTYLPPPPPKKQKTAELRLEARDAETCICMDGPLPQPYFVCFTFVPSLSSVSKPEISDGRVTLSTSLRRNGPAKLAHTCCAVRFKWRAHSLQTRPWEDPSGTHA